MQGTIPELADSDTIAGLSLFTRTILKATGTLNPKAYTSANLRLKAFLMHIPIPTPPSLVFGVAAQTSNQESWRISGLGSIRFRV